MEAKGATKGSKEEAKGATRGIKEEELPRRENWDRRSLRRKNKDRKDRKKSEDETTKNVSLTFYFANMGEQNQL